MPKLPTLSDETLELLGLKPKDMTVYTHLLKLGTAPLRRIAEVTNLNRGTTYDALKRLIDVGLVSHMDKGLWYFVSKLVQPRPFSSAKHNRFHGSRI